MSTPFEPGVPLEGDAIPLERAGNPRQRVAIRPRVPRYRLGVVGGQYVDRFERAMAEHAGCRRAVATVNGTAALHVALRVAGVEPDDEVLVSDLTFIAPVNAIRYFGAWPVLIDAEPHYWQMDPEQVGDFLVRRCQWHDGRLAESRDGTAGAGHAAGPRAGPSRGHGSAAGAGPQVRAAGGRGRQREYRGPLQGAAGGQPGRHRLLQLQRQQVDHDRRRGHDRDPNDAWADKVKYWTTQAKDDPLEYIHSEIGYNYRLTNVLAAIGVAQMEQLDEYIAAKRRIAGGYTRGLARFRAYIPCHKHLGRRARSGCTRCWWTGPNTAWEAANCWASWKRRASRPGRSGSRCTPARPTRPCEARRLPGGRSPAPRRPEPALFGRNYGCPARKGHPGNLRQKTTPKYVRLSSLTLSRTLSGWKA